MHRKYHIECCIELRNLVENPVSSSAALRHEMQCIENHVSSSAALRHEMQCIENLLHLDTILFAHSQNYSM